MIIIVDYGMGNLRSVEKAFVKLGLPVQVTSRPKVVEKAKGLVVPGVGSFAEAMKNIEQMGLKEVILENIAQDKPYLGICLGLQILFSESEEESLCQGLNVLEGRVRRLPSGVKVPHMGWNQVRIQKKNLFLDGIRDNSNFYFVHSYYVEPKDKGISATTTEYSITFTSSVYRGNLFGVQWHPEKSSQGGLQILKNFGGMCHDYYSSR